MNRIVLTLTVLVCFAPTPARALSLGFSPPDLHPGETASGHFTILSPGDLLGWQGRWFIQPVGSVSGAVTITGPPVGPAPFPGDYVFTSSLGINVTEQTSSTLAAFDLRLLPLTEPVLSNANLLEAFFSATPDASGIWEVRADDSIGQSVFTDLSDTHPFDNVPPGPGTGVAIGQITVLPSVPEPSAAGLALTGFLGALTVVWRRRRRNHAS